MSKKKKLPYIYFRSSEGKYVTVPIHHSVVPLPNDDDKLRHKYHFDPETVIDGKVLPIAKELDK